MIKTQYAVFEKVPTHSNKPDSVILGPYNTKEEAQGDRVKYGYNTDNYYVDAYNSDVEKYINDLIKKTKKIPYNNELNGDYNVK